MVYVKRVSLCAGAGFPAPLEPGCPEMVEIVFQTPYEIAPGPSIQLLGPGRRLQLLKKGTAFAERPFELRIGFDPNRHSDPMWPSLLRYPTATHLDGTVISSLNPVSPGQEIILYVADTGRPLSSSEIHSGAGGEAQPPLTTDAFQLSVVQDYSRNVLQEIAVQPSPPLRAYFVSGAVGLTAAHVRVPPAPPGALTPRRTVLAGGSLTQGIVSSNLVVSLRMHSGAPIQTGLCVVAAPEAPQYPYRFNPRGYPILHRTDWVGQ
jgi:hypothetical protein